VDHQSSELGRKLLWLMLLRVVIVTVLLGIAIVLQVAAGPLLPFNINPHYAIIAVTYLLTLIYAFAYRRLQASSGFATLQLALDQILATALIYFTGPDGDSFSFLYIVVVIASATLLPRAASFGLASLGVLLYGALASASYFAPAAVGLLGSGASGRELLSLILLNAARLYLVAFLSSYLSESLRHSRVRLEQVVECMSAGLLTADLGGRILMHNRAACSISGYAPGELKEKSLYELFDAGPEFMDQLRAGLVREKIHRFQRPLRSASGPAVLVGVSTTLLSQGDQQPRGLVLIFQDLTEIRRLEEEVRRRDRMATLGEAAAVLAHEIRNPLASMSGSAQMLRSEARLDPESHSLLDIILTESERLNRFVTSFLMFARPAGTQLQTVDPALHLAETVALLNNSAERLPSHAIQLVPAAEPLELLADPGQLKQIFWNLMLNALRAMPEGGTLEVGAMRLPDHKIRFRFADRGVGLSPAERENLFVPFQGSFRGGSGLGLALVQKIVRDHQGSLQVLDRPGGGTEVLVDLPIASELASAALAPRRARVG